MSLPNSADAAVSAAGAPLAAIVVRFAHLVATPPRRRTGRARVLVVGGLKGGVGKSTVALFIAMVYAYVHGMRVLFVDADPSSQTGYDWWSQAADAGRPLPFDIECWPHAQVGDMVRRRSLEAYDVVIIDCGGDSDKILASAMEVADTAVMVTSPSKTDMRRLGSTFTAALNAAKEHGRASEINAGVMLTQVDQRRGAQGAGVTKHNEKMRARIRDAGMPLMSAELSLKASVYSDSNGHPVKDADDLAEAAALVAEIESEFPDPITAAGA